MSNLTNTFLGLLELYDWLRVPFIWTLHTTKVVKLVLLFIRSKNAWRIRALFAHNLNYVDYTVL